MTNLKAIRKARGMSQDDLGGLLGVTRQTVYNWENGQAWPSAEMLPRIAKALGCSIGELFGETTDTENYKQEAEI